MPSPGRPFKRVALGECSLQLKGPGDLESEEASPGARSHAIFELHWVFGKEIPFWEVGFIKGAIPPLALFFSIPTRKYSPLPFFHSLH